MVIQLLRAARTKPKFDKSVHFLQRFDIGKVHLPTSESVFYIAFFIAALELSLARNDLLLDSPPHRHLVLLISRQIGDTVLFEEFIVVLLRHALLPGECRFVIGPDEFVIRAENVGVGSVVGSINQLINQSINPRIPLQQRRRPGITEKIVIYQIAMSRICVHIVHFRANLLLGLPLGHRLLFGRQSIGESVRLDGSRFCRVQDFVATSGEEFQYLANRRNSPVVIERAFGTLTSLARRLEVLGVEIADVRTSMVRFGWWWRRHFCGDSIWKNGWENNLNFSIVTKNKTPQLQIHHHSQTIYILPHFIDTPK